MSVLTLICFCGRDVVLDDELLGTARCACGRRWAAADVDGVIEIRQVGWLEETP